MPCSALASSDDGARAGVREHGWFVLAHALVTTLFRCEVGRWLIVYRRGGSLASPAAAEMADGSAASDH
jgi:hypothetical protein